MKLKTIEAGIGERLGVTDIRSVAPAVFNRNIPSHLSNRYCLIPTCDIVDIAASEGWAVVKAASSWPRGNGPNSFSRHLLVFRRYSDLGIDHPEIDPDILPEIILINSHDARCSYRFYSGLYRLACLNGLIIPGLNTGSIICCFPKFPYRVSDLPQERGR